MRNKFLFSAIILMGAVGGCGTHVPSLHESWEEADIDDDLAYRIKSSIYCELRRAVSEFGTQESEYQGRIVDKIPDNWAAQITLTLQIDEKSAFNPSISRNETLADAIVRFPGGGSKSVGRSFTLPFSAAVSSQSTRVDKYYQFLLLKNLKKKIEDYETSCKKPNGTAKPTQDLDRHGSSYLFGNLGIRDWMKGALRVAETGPSSPSAPVKTDAFSYDISFVVLTSGSINPTWQLVSLSTGIGGLPLLHAERTRTHQLVLTLGPTQTVRSTERSITQVAPSFGASNLHVSGEIRQAISSGFRSALGQ